MDKKVKLMPCPFCGNTDIEVAFCNGDHWAMCRECKSSTEMRSTKAVAIECWNTRAAMQDPAGGADWDVIADAIISDYVQSQTKKRTNNTPLPLDTLKSIIIIHAKKVMGHG